MLPVAGKVPNIAFMDHDRLAADDDPCAQAILDLQIQRIGAVYDLSAVPSPN
jgi:hypothetical protein